MNKLGIIGGRSYSDGLLNLQSTHEATVTTPYGAPSAPLLFGTLEDSEVVFLSRHGQEAILPPHQINYRANLWALHDAGVSTLVSFSDFFSLVPHFKVADLILPHQLIDFTAFQDISFYDGGSHWTCTNFVQPFTEDLRQRCLSASADVERLHDAAVVGATSAPRMNTAAEIQYLVHAGCELSAFGLMPEAALARELGIEYVSLGVVTQNALHPTDTLPQNVPDAIESIIKIARVAFRRVD